MRISTTTLESFRLWAQPDQDWMSEQELIDTIRGKFVPTPKVLIGKAFGQILEDPEPFRVHGGYMCGAYFFSVDTMAPALALMDRRGVFEAKATKDYGDCTVVAKADQLVGAHLIEHKTRLGSFDFEKYADSYQWRFMADIFEPTRITYHVFILDGDEEGATFGLKSIESFSLFPYPQLHADCQALLDQFVEYVTLRRLDGLLRDRQRLAAAELV